MATTAKHGSIQKKLFQDKFCLLATEREISPEMSDVVKHDILAHNNAIRAIRDTKKTHISPDASYIKHLQSELYSPESRDRNAYHRAYREKCRRLKRTV